MSTWRARRLKTAARATNTPPLTTAAPKSHGAAAGATALGHEAGRGERAGDEGGEGAGLGEPEAAPRPRAPSPPRRRPARSGSAARRCRSPACRTARKTSGRAVSPGSMAMASVAAPKLTSALRTPRSLRSAPCSLIAQSAQSMPVTCRMRRSPPSSPGSGRERSSGPCACAASGQWSSQWAWAPARRAKVSTSPLLSSCSSKLTPRRPRATSGSTAWMPSSRSSSRPTSSTQPPHSAARGSRSESSRVRCVKAVRPVRRQRDEAVVRERLARRGPPARARRARA